MSAREKINVRAIRATVPADGCAIVAVRSDGTGDAIPLAVDTLGTHTRPGGLLVRLIEPTRNSKDAWTIAVLRPGSVDATWREREAFRRVLIASSLLGVRLSERLLVIPNDEAYSWNEASP